MLLAQACLLHQTFRWLTPHGIPGRALRRRSPNCTFGILDLFVPILSIPVRNIWGFLGSSAGQGSSMQEILVRSLGWEDPLEEGMATHSGILPWTIPMDRGACRATVHRVAKSGTQLKWLSMHTCTTFLVIIHSFSLLYVRIILHTGYTVESWESDTTEPQHRNICPLDIVNPVSKMREAALGTDSILFGRGSFCVDLVSYHEVSSHPLLCNCLFEALRDLWGIFLLLLPTRTICFLDIILPT